MDELEWFDSVRKNELVFRAILRDLRDNRNKLPGMVRSIAHMNLDTQSELEVLLKEYSGGERKGKFTISYFSRPSSDCATIFIMKDIAPLSGSGIGLGYRVNSDNSVEYKETLGIRMS